MCVIKRVWFTGVICSVISLKIKVMVSLISPGLLDATKLRELTVVPGDISPISEVMVSLMCLHPP